MMCGQDYMIIESGIPEYLYITIHNYLVSEDKA